MGAGKAPLVDATVVARDIASGTDREIARGYLEGLTLSPDGRFLATAANDPVTASRSIRLIPVAGGQARDVLRMDVTRAYLEGTSTFSRIGAVFTWLPDSQSILVQGPSLLWVPIDGRESPKLVDLGSMGHKAGFTINYDADFSISPDGRRIAFIAGSRPTIGLRTPLELHVLEHFLPAGK